MTRTTMRNVAAHAGVSYQTVSNVLNDHPSIRPATRDRVLAAIKELDYYPNQAAKALRQSRTTTLCCAFFGHNAEDIHDPYRNLIQSAFVAEANAHGYSMTIAFLNQEHPETFDHFRQRYLQGLFGGAVLVGTTLPTSHLLEIQSYGVQTVLFDHVLPDSAATTISADYEGGIATMVGHHIAQGRTRLALLIPSGDPGSSAQARLRGFQRATSEYGVEAKVISSSWSYASGEAAMQTLWASGARPDAVLAASDRIAAGALRAAHDLGLRVPTDVAISGFDDFEFAQYTYPQLTTLHVPHGEMAREAVRRLVAQVEQLELPPADVFPVSLVVRESA